ncbi:MAG: family 43 glycosylhydrolase [Eisenbergiella sp.]
MIHWEPLDYPLTDSSADLQEASQGVWAPCLTYDKGIFYLVYTVVKGSPQYGRYINYLVTASDIRGPWSDPVPLNNFGFDPSFP